MSNPAKCLEREDNTFLFGFPADDGSVTGPVVFKDERMSAELEERTLCARFALALQMGIVLPFFLSFQEEEKNTWFLKKRQTGSTDV